MLHPTALIDPSAILGEGTVVWAFSSIGANAVIGKHCRIGQGVYIDRGVRIGDRCVIHNKASIYRPVALGDDVFIGPHVVFANDPDPRSDLTRDDFTARWRIHDGVTIGANCTILSDIDLAPHTFIGAGAVVTKLTLAFGLYVGVPARLVGFRCTCRKRYPLDPGLPGACEQCQRPF